VLFVNWFVLVAGFCVWLINVFKSIGRLIFHMEEKITIKSFSILNLYRSNSATKMHARAIGEKTGASHVILLQFKRVRVCGFFLFMYPSWGIIHR